MDKLDLYLFAPRSQVYCLEFTGKKLKSFEKKLTKAKYKLGTAKGPKSMHAMVSTQKPKPGTVLAAGGKVNVTLK
jgi:hypothetical protein